MTSKFVTGLAEVQHAAWLRRHSLDERGWAAYYIKHRCWQYAEETARRVEMRRLGRIMTEQEILTSDSQVVQDEALLEWQRVLIERKHYHDLAALIWHALDDIDSKAEMQGNIRGSKEAADAHGIEQITQIIFDYFDGE